MTLRLFILQAHYRSTLDFSNDALKASEKGLNRLLKLASDLPHIRPAAASSQDYAALEKKCLEAMSDDLNTPVLIGHLFDATRWVNSIQDGKETINQQDLDIVKGLFDRYLFRVLGIQPVSDPEKQDDLTDDLIRTILDIRAGAKARKDYDTADGIREALQKLGIIIKDGKDGADWER